MPYANKIWGYGMYKSALIIVPELIIPNIFMAETALEFNLYNRFVAGGGVQVRVGDACNSTEDGTTGASNQP